MPNMQKVLRKLHVSRCSIPAWCETLGESVKIAAAHHSRVRCHRLIDSAFDDNRQLPADKMKWPVSALPISTVTLGYLEKAGVIYVEDIDLDILRDRAMVGVATMTDLALALDQEGIDLDEPGV